MKELLLHYIAFLNYYIPIEVYGGLIFVLCSGIIIFLTFYGFERGMSKIAGLLLIEYIFFIFCSTVFFREYVSEQECKFIPFWSYTEILLNGKKIVLVENIMNVVVFVPLGMLFRIALPLIKIGHVLGAVCLISVSIELLQILLNRGFGEIDDVFHNTIGCVIGFYLVKCIEYLYKNTLVFKRRNNC